MNTNELHLLHLHYSCGGNFRLVKKYYEYDPSFSKLYLLSTENLAKILGIQISKASTIANHLTSVSIQSILDDLSTKNISYVTVFDHDYPILLKNIYDPPWVIYYQGDFSLFHNQPLLSVVGTRHPSSYIQDELKIILQPVIHKGISIVSGLALGVDRMAHHLTIEEKGHTIAVLGYGLNWIYPHSNASLFHEIRRNHLLISEYPPFVRPQKWHFPERNRIISGLSNATFVVEAKEKSGSLITSDLALQQGRDVFALPGRISDSESLGTNKLIQEGAKIILRANDILEEYFTY
ncbi:DNA-processing protein DprA [Evansella sp. AB-rgal1]|uniref:DNA-processing protein DprA n=1 Tax=Evansella sp. AB-rgal1 TaxID=3242696 RepID=UPI00359EEF5A